MMVGKSLGSDYGFTKVFFKSKSALLRVGW